MKKVGFLASRPPYQTCQILHLSGFLSFCCLLWWLISSIGIYWFQMQDHADIILAQCCSYSVTISIFLCLFFLWDYGMLYAPVICIPCSPTYGEWRDNDFHFSGPCGVKQPCSLPRPQQQKIPLGKVSQCYNPRTSPALHLSPAIPQLSL